MRIERCRYFVRLDAQAADLHLLVAAPDKGDLAVGQKPRQISRLEKPFIWSDTEWIRNELLRGQLRAVSITARHPYTSDVKFANRFLGHLVACFIQNVDLRIGDGTADWWQVIG